MTGRPNPKVAVVKPSYGTFGGFERQLAQVLAELRSRGWDLTIVEADVLQQANRLYGMRLEPEMVAVHHEFFRYLSMVEQFQQIDVSSFDAVLTTQPPSYLVRHPRKLALFYHQARHFYDLADPFASDGFVDPRVHDQVVAGVRRLEREAVQDVRHWLAGSQEIASRLEEYWGIPEERMSLYWAPPTSFPDRVVPHDGDGPVVIVGRVEWPKRVELFVNAIHRTKRERHANVVGSGSRLPGARRLDAALHQSPDLEGHREASEPWRDQVGAAPRFTEPIESLSGRITFEGNVSNRRRDDLYEQASVVVAPAYREDYGLTAIEAGIRARPVIVCSDGGGLTELVTDGVTGLIVEPKAEAMAEAIDRLTGDPDLAARLGEAAREWASELSLDRAVSQIEAALIDVLA